MSGRVSAGDSVGLVERIVVDAIKGVTNGQYEDITPETDLLDIGLDSLDFAIVLVLIEDAAGEEVPASALERLAEFGDIRTVGDVVTLLDGWTPVRP